MARDLERIMQMLCEETDQIWKKNSLNTHHHDQYGFAIFKTDDHYILYYKGHKIMPVHKMATAKAISRIILNDIINFKQFKFD